MSTAKKKNFLFAIMLLVVLVLAVIYFTVPERVRFLQGQLSWWRALAGLVIQ